MRRILLVSAFGAAVLAVGTVAACTSSGAGGGSAKGDLVEQAANAGGGESAAAAPSAGSGRAGTGAAGGSTSAPDTPAGLELSTGVRIRTAELTVGVHGAGNIAARADAADDVAIRVGGEIDADERTTGKFATATLRLRVPPAELLGVLRDLSKLGVEQSRQVSSKDVTEQVADVSSRVSSAQQAIARLRVLYAHAQKVADVISIEGELSTREADLESLQSQQRALAQQTAMAAVTLNLRTVIAAKHHPAKKKDMSAGGFVGGLSSGWHAFVHAATAFGTGAGAALPFLVLVLLLALAARFAWPRLRRTPSPAPAPIPAPASPPSE